MYLESDPGVADVHDLLIPHYCPVSGKSADYRGTAALDHEGGFLCALVEGHHTERRKRSWKIEMSSRKRQTKESNTILRDTIYFVCTYRWGAFC